MIDDKRSLLQICVPIVQATVIAEAPMDLDQLFTKTKAEPHLYYLPLTEDEAATRSENKAEAAARKATIAADK